MIPLLWPYRDQQGHGLDGPLDHKTLLERQTQHKNSADFTSNPLSAIHRLTGRTPIMKLLRNLLILGALLVGGCADSPDLMDAAIKIAQQSGAVSGSLSTSEIASGLKEALRVGAGNVVGRLGVPNGFNADPKVHIPLPDSLRKARNIASKLGMGDSFKDLETRLNRAAETATPVAKELFFNAISQMTLDDARGILSGPDDAATRYFQRKMTAPLSARMKPIVNQAVSRAGVIQSYNQAIGQLGPLASALPDYQGQLVDHVLKRSLDGVFYYLAQEEAAIRHDPAKRITALLKKVFGAQR